MRLSNVLENPDLWIEEGDQRLEEVYEIAANLRWVTGEKYNEEKFNELVIRAQEILQQLDQENDVVETALEALQTGVSLNHLSGEILSN